MQGQADTRTPRAGISWRPVAWGVAALLLMLPLVAMQFTDEVAWTASDFAVFAAMLAFALGGFELATRIGGEQRYRVAAALGLVAAFLLFWVNGAVGIIAGENNPANLGYMAVLLVAIGGALLARGRPGGLAVAMGAAALLQLLVPLAAIVSGGLPDERAMQLDVVWLTAFFVALWLVAAWLFRQCATSAPRS